MRERIDLEHEAAQRGMHGPALGTARHDFINARAEHLAEHVFALRDAGRVQEALGVMLNDEVWEGEQAYCLICHAALPGTVEHEHTPSHVDPGLMLASNDSEVRDDS
jgi:hypothetical protein